MREEVPEFANLQLGLFVAAILYLYHCCALVQCVRTSHIAIFSLVPVIWEVV